MMSSYPARQHGAGAITSIVLSLKTDTGKEKIPVFYHSIQMFTSTNITAGDGDAFETPSDL